MLRYDKRTYVHAARLTPLAKTLTVKEEVIDDALLAVTLLRQNKSIDSRRVFVLGHSLGGMVAPRIAQQNPNIAGLIILAGPTRPLEDLILEQSTYISSLDGLISDKNKAEQDKLKAQAARVKDTSLSKDTPASDLPMNVPASYWLDLHAHPPAEVVCKIKQPMLILQGERDYQVTMEDFAGWKKMLAERKDVVLKSYPRLNHLFMEGEKKSRPDEYLKVDHVASQVIDNIAEWITQR